MLLGCIADDFTGATDLANMLVRGGMRTIQTIGVPSAPLGEEVDAVVVALKSRTIPAAAGGRAVAGGARLAASRPAAGSSISSTARPSIPRPNGNIGPVTDALMDALQADFTIACPAFPETGRTICRGYLFVGDVLLSESGMKDHPLTPMTDANLVRVLQPQTRRKVGLIRYDGCPRRRCHARAQCAALQQDGIGIAIVDALAEADLRTASPRAAPTCRW